MHTKTAFSNSSGLKGVFVKLSFHDRLRMDGRPNQRDKDAFLNSSGAVGGVSSILLRAITSQ